MGKATVIPFGPQDPGDFPDFAARVGQARQQGQLGPLGRGLAQQRLGLGQVVVKVIPGDHLEDGNAQ